MTDNSLFKDDASADSGPCTGAIEGLIKPTPHLPADSRAYARGQISRAADPIGLLGMPNDRESLDRLLLELCNRLAAAGGGMLSAKRLVEDLGIESDRALRLLMAYGHVRHRIRDLVGIEGSGYTWGALNPDAYAAAASVAKRKGLCALYLAALYSKVSPIVQICQLALDFKTGDQKTDEVDAWMAAEDVTPATLCEAFVDTLAATPAGRQALQQAAAKRPGMFLPAETVRKMRQQAEDTLAILDAAG